MKQNRRGDWLNERGLKLYLSETIYFDKDVWLPQYSTDIAASWEVVGKLQHEGYRLEIVLGSQGDAYATFVMMGLRLRGESDTTPHAICLAALKAIR